jgi:hypothetical protein
MLSNLGTDKKSHRIDINLFMAISIWMSTRKYERRHLKRTPLL